MSIYIQEQIVQLIKANSIMSNVEPTLGLPNLDNLIIYGDSQAWVYELAGNPIAVEGTGKLLQQETQLYAVLIGIKTHNDNTGSSATAQLQQARQEVRQALFDVVPSPNYWAFELAGAELLHFAENAVFWVERFKTSHLISSENLL